MKKVIKRFLGRVPFLKRLAEIYYINLPKIYVSDTQIDELSSLIKEGKLVVLHPYFKMGKEKLAHEIVHDVVKDYLVVYRAVRFKKKDETNVSFPIGAVLLGQPLALLRIPSTHEEYLKLVGPKTRNMIRKAERNGYIFNEFAWNDHLNEIFDINTSKEVRSGGAMFGWYNKSVNPRHYKAGEEYYRKSTEFSKMENYVLICILYCVEILLFLGTL